jgi:hypothetical protein
MQVSRIRPGFIFRFAAIVVTLCGTFGLDAQAQNATTIRVKLNQDVTTRSANRGDRVTARLLQPLRESTSVVAPTGSVLAGRVDFVQEKTANEDGWLFLVFNRLELPDGQTISTTASASFFKIRKHSTRNGVLLVTGLAALGAILGGRNEGVTAGLGGALVGFLWVGNRSSTDLNLHAGQTIRLRLNE